MPLFITPITKAPMTTPITLPTPPEAEAPPMKQAAMTSSSKELPALGVAELSRAATIRPASPASTPMLTKVRKVSRSVRMPGELRGQPVAAERVDAPADRHPRRHEGVEQDQHAHDDEHFRQALIGGELVAEEQDQHGEDRVLADEQRERLGVHGLRAARAASGEPVKISSRGADDADQHRAQRNFESPKSGLERCSVIARNRG